MTDAMLDDLLKGLDEDIEVPEAATMAWKKAVKSEMRTQKLRRSIKYMGSVAALLAVVIGLAVFMRPQQTEEPVFVLLETDSSFEEAATVEREQLFGCEVEVIEKTDEYRIIEIKTQDIQTVLEGLGEDGYELYVQTDEYIQIKLKE